MTNRSGMSRRRTLLGTAALASVPLSMPFISKAGAADPIKIGLLLAKTGQIAPQTEYLAQGTYLALEQRNNMIGGRPAELVWLDKCGHAAMMEQPREFAGALAAWWKRHISH